MKKFIRIFYSQIFNSFFPILIVIILIRIKDKNDIAQIFFLLNLSNVYLLFSDYSSNIHFFRHAIQMGGIVENTHQKIIDNINHYIGIKTIILSVGFIVWIVLCYTVPLLRKNPISNILSYSFIVGYNINFYWIYMSSVKEYYFIVSNFFARLCFLVLLLVFIALKYNFYYLMPIVGIGSIIIGLMFFKQFCKMYSLPVSLTIKSIKESMAIIKEDLPLVSNSFLLMTPSNCLSIFIGYVKKTEHIIIYALAEKIFLAFRTLLGVFINSIYPVLCDPNFTKEKRRNIFILYYVAIIAGCFIIHFIAPYLLAYFHLPIAMNTIFYSCLFYFILTIIVISINVPFFLWTMIHNVINTKKMFYLLLLSTIIIISTFVYFSTFENGVISVTKSVLMSEALIVVCFGVLYLTNQKEHSKISINSTH